MNANHEYFVHIFVHISLFEEMTYECFRSKIYETLLSVFVKNLTKSFCFIFTFFHFGEGKM